MFRSSIPSSTGARILPGEPVPGLTYTLTATHPTRARRRQPSPTARHDAPTVQLFGAPTGLIAPGDDADRHGERRRRHRQGRVLSRRDADRHRHRGAVLASSVLVPADAGRSPSPPRPTTRGQRQDEQRRQRPVGVADAHAAGGEPGRQPATLVAPGTVTLQASASDAGGIARSSSIAERPARHPAVRRT